jgi:hypothetical protein
VLPTSLPPKVETGSNVAEFLRSRKKRVSTKLMPKRHQA